MRNNEKLVKWIENPSLEYNQFQNNINDQIKKEIKIRTEKSIDTIKLVDEKVEEIKKLRLDIAQRRKKDKIGARKFANVIIIIFSIILIGLPFLYFLIKNKKVIKEYNEFASTVENQIFTIVNEKNRLINNVLKTINAYEFANAIFNQNGLTLRQNPNFSTVNLAKFNNNKRYFVGYVDGIHVNFKSTDTLYYRYKVFSYEPVVTYNTIQVNKDTTATAQHVEMTPVVKLSDEYVHKTNFDPNFNFRTHMQTIKKKDNSIFLNHDFAMKYGIGLSSKNLSIQIESKLHEFFTPLAQEQFVKWDNDNKGQVYPFEKFADDIFISHGYNPMINFEEIKNKTLNYYSKRSYNEISTVFDILDTYAINLKSIIDVYLTNLSTIIQSPAISREWYEKNKPYRISTIYNYDEYINYKIDLNHEVVSNKILTNGLVNFFNKSDVIPFLEFVEQINLFGVKKNIYDLISYNIYDRIDRVPVYVDGRTVSVPVPYKEYVEFKYPILVYFVENQKIKNDNEIDSIWLLSAFMGNNILMDEKQSSYIRDEIGDFFAENQNDEKVMPKHLIQEFNQLKSQIESDAKKTVRFIKDRDGYFVVVSNASEISNEIEQHLTTWLRKISL